MAIKGWTKMDEGSWRHDGVGTSNKLKIYADMGDNKVHIANKNNRKRPVSYDIIYTNNDHRRVGGKRGSTQLKQAETLQEAKSLASRIRRQNPETLPDKVQTEDNSGLLG